MPARQCQALAGGLRNASFRFSGIPVSAFFRIPEPGGRTSEIGNRNSEAGGSLRSGRSQAGRNTILDPSPCFFTPLSKKSTPRGRGFDLPPEGARRRFPLSLKRPTILLQWLIIQKKQAVLRMKAI